MYAAQAVGYTSAGTIEFLVSGDDVYFMEMNTRIQVEHPVSEMLYGIDLIAEQIRVASGQGLSVRQKDLAARGHVIECRINAEDAGANFAPAAGTLDEVALPGGFGVRVDSHIYGGLAIPPYYDSLLAKIIAHGATRDGAITRMDCALRDTRITGVSTTVDVCRAVLFDYAFRRGGVPVDYLPTLIAGGIPA
jgi:acetyl-CoA carboxylase biotin carboxylase subunit